MLPVLGKKQHKPAERDTDRQFHISALKLRSAERHQQRAGRAAESRISDLLAKIVAAI